MTERPGDRDPTPALASKLLGRGYQGAVWLEQRPAGPVIVKKAIGRGPARALSRAMLRREFAIYDLLRGIRGVPACHGLSGNELVLEFIDGRSLREASPAPELRERFFAELLALIESIHRAGVAHGDLKRKDNIFLGRDGHPYVIDFGTAVSAPPGSGYLRRLAFRELCRMDLNAWVKLKYQRQGVPVAAGDEACLRPTAAERVARVVRRTWRAATFRRLRKAHRRNAGDG
jgi:predicted Ser/Thr protein kinase